MITIWEMNCELDMVHNKEMSPNWPLFVVSYNGGLDLVQYMVTTFESTRIIAWK